MAETSINLTEGSGKRTHGWDRTISSVLVQDQFVLPGEYPYATYVAAASALVPVADCHVMQVMAGSTNYVRIRRIEMKQIVAGNATAVPVMEIRRLTTAGTGGTSVTPAPYDVGDAASGATAMTLPSSKGTEGTLLWSSSFVGTNDDTGISVQTLDRFVWEQHRFAKPIVIAAGTSNGIAVKWATSASTLHTVSISIMFVETA